MAAEIVCSRWTALVLREMLCGSTRFNDLRRGVPRMSPTLLSKRLKELELAGVISAKHSRESGVVEYTLTQAGELFLERARDPETQRRTGLAMSRGFQTHEGEMALGEVLGDLAGN